MKSKLLGNRARLAFAGLICATSLACEADVEYVVTTTEDYHDLSPGDGVCGAFSGGPCALRAAIEEANATADNLAVKVTVPVGYYPLNHLLPLELTRGEVHVQGAGVEKTVIDGLKLTRIVEISGWKVDGVVFEDLTLVNGRALDDSDSPEPKDWGRGGAVWIDATDYRVVFEDTVVFNNHADGSGGGIYANGTGHLWVINTEMFGNQAGDLGESCDSTKWTGAGAIAVIGGTLNLVQSELRDNCGSTGAIYLRDGANHHILRSTIAENLSNQDAAGLWVEGVLESPYVRIEDSTIAGNRITVDSDALWRAAGVLIYGAWGDQEIYVEIIGSTIADNVNPYPVNYPLYGAAQAIWADDTSLVTMQNTVLSGPREKDAPLCDATIISLGGNYLSHLDSECFVAAVETDLIGYGDPGLNALAKNGGITRTMLPTASSPLVDAGVPGCEDIDQRGVDFPAPKGKACDIGAVER